jgi:hypothetical protein
VATARHRSRPLAVDANPYLFPEKKLNQKQLDLFALYKAARAASPPAPSAAERSCR